MGLAGKGTAAAKIGLLAAWLAVLAPFIGIFAGFASQWLVIRATTPAGRERRAKTTELLAFWAAVLVTAVGGEQAVRSLGHRLDWSDTTFFYALASFWWLYVAGMTTWQIIFVRRNWAARQQREAVGEILQIPTGTRVSLTIGLHLAVFSWVIALAWNAHDPVTATIVAGMMIGMAVWNYSRLRNLEGLAAAHASGRHYGLCCLLILAVINLRLDVWLATRYETGVAEIHQLFPMWLIPLLTLALLLWIGLVMAMTSSKRRV